MYRIFCKNSKSFVDNVMLLPDDTIVKYEKRKFLPLKVYAVNNDDDNYVIQYKTDLFDKNEMPIYEGDLCTCPNSSNENTNSIGVVAYSQEINSFCIFDYENSVYYPLNSALSREISVVGVVFDSDWKEKYDISS